MIRDANSQDFAQILALNAESVSFLSPLDQRQLEFLHGDSAYHRVVESDGRVVAFLLALREGSAYDSVNYRWFSQRYAQFLYVDRIVVSVTQSGRGFGRQLYDDLFAFARLERISPVTCEFDVDPPNEASRRFHQRFGFKQVGSQLAGTANKRVSLQAALVVNYVEEK